MEFVKATRKASQKENDKQSGNARGTTSGEKKVPQFQPCCDYCGHSFPASSLSKCSGCQRYFYCSKACQKKDWKEHKSTCNWYIDLKKKYADNEEYVKETVASCCLYSRGMILPQDEIREAGESQRQIYDLARESPLTCQICCEVIYGQEECLSSFPECSHGFCEGCLEPHSPLFKEDVENDHESQLQECPLCYPNNAVVFRSCYFHVTDFLYRAESLYPKGSLPSHHFYSVAKREYDRLLTLIPLFPTELSPLQLDMLQLKIYDLLHADEDNKQRLEGKKKIAKHLVRESRDMKDVARKLEIYCCYITILIDLKEIKEAKIVCSLILREIKDVHEPNLAALKFQNYQPLYATIKQQWIDIIYQQALLEEDHKAKEKGFREVIQLSNAALTYNRHDTTCILLLADVHERLINFKEAILALEFGLHYDLHTDSEQTEKMRSKLQFLKEITESTLIRESKSK